MGAAAVVHPTAERYTACLGNRDHLPRGATLRNVGSRLLQRRQGEQDANQLRIGRGAY